MNLTSQTPRPIAAIPNLNALIQYSTLCETAAGGAAETLGSLTLFETYCYITRSFVLSYSFQIDHRRHLAIEQFRQLSLHF
jgi:hypothetical protein